jgi:hypothetical protein
VFTSLTALTWLGILIAVVVSGGLAAVYFPVLIAKPYARALDRVGREPAPSSAVSNFGPVLCIVITVITSAVLIRALDITTVGPAIVFGLVVGIGYLTAMTFQIAINPNFARPILYGLINAPFFIVTAVINSVILALLH